ncbi:ATP-dependent helicase [Candidatus Pacearchaeota archaeon RBG_13_36_9]|nr:MAG: ATP-dependent helicase [Candidatus Pacearchaeota archaeon RBG_13_36_9]
MIEQINKPNSDKEILNSLTPLVGKWFKEKFGGFTESQKYAILPIKGRKNILVSSPTGSGKTLCAFASILDYLISLEEKGELENKTYCIYVSPLKALSRDIEVNLNTPLKEMEKIRGKKLGIRVGLRTGDTTTTERSKMLKKVPHILITTPETLAIVLTTRKFVELLKGTEFVIVDEIHSLANKRGVYLSLSLERLEEISKITPVRIGLSATVAPLEEVANFLVGQKRDCLVADVQFIKKTDIKVITPVSDLIDVEGQFLHSSLYGLLDRLIQEHKTTVVFTNTRSATERVVHHLKERFPDKYLENIGAHHSSLSKEHRFNIEQRLREGKLKVVVTSTSLELGIDIGYIDLVILLGSPKSVARSLQRIGRAGHKLHDIAKGRFIAMDRDDLVECCVLAKEAMERKIDKIQIPQNCLDVLSQQIYGMAIYKIWEEDEMFSIIRKSYCYRNLSREDFLNVLSYLSGEYELEARNVYAKVWYDKETRQIGKKGKLARVIYMTNIGTIPEESFVSVQIAAGEGIGQKIGVIDEAFLERMKKGDVFVLGGQKYQYMYVKGMNIYVNSSVKRPPTIPSWFSEMLPLSFDSANEINRFRKLVEERLKQKNSPEEIKGFIEQHLYCEKEAGEAIYNYFYEQFRYAVIPHEKKIVIERYKGEKNYAIFHSLYGRRVNDALSRAMAFLVGRAGGRDIEVGIRDNGFYLAGEKLEIEKALKFLNSKNVEEILEEAINKTEVLNRRFRHCATRALMILRNYKGRRKTVGKQQMKSHFLLASVKRISHNFPILKEARREVMEDLMDINNTRVVLDRIKEGKVKIEQINVKLPSPFALSIVLEGYTDLLKMEDKIEFLKRMHKEHLKEIEERK